MHEAAPAGDLAFGGTSMQIRALLLVLSLALAGCASEGELKVDSQSSPLQSSYESVRVAIQPTAKDSQEIIGDVRSSVVGQLLSSGRFHRISADGEPADVIVTVDIVQYERVSVGERILVGALAGRNRVSARVTVSDGRTGSVIRRFEAQGKSAAHPLSSEAGYTDALREFSRQVLLGLSA
ncbi:MAG TPA: DUF4410 domain-containing protein [Stellaceae bacterium]|nr:DUF4410 domain-containing protein [Stellaceae bacterium]